jgi:hypothetical protein
MYSAIIDYLDVAAKSYKMNKIARLVKGHLSQDRAESTLRNELNQQEKYKLGLITAIQIMQITKDLTALDVIESLFDRVAFKLPKHIDGNPSTIMKLASKLSKEFGEAIEEMGEAMEDGKLTRSERTKCLNEVRDLIKVGVELEAFLMQDGEN